MSKFKLYTSCIDLPLDRFIKCIVDGDHRALVIKGNPSDADILESWANIWAEYLDLNQDNEALYVLQLQKDITLLRYHTTEIEAVVALLWKIHHPELVQVLRDRGYNQPLDPENTEQYNNSLTMIHNSIASDRLQLEMRENELAEYVKSRMNETIDRKYFDRMLVRLSKHMGYWQRAKEITVAEFVNMIKDLMEYQKAKSPASNEDGD